MNLAIQKYFLLFFALSVVGWLMEVVCKYIQFGRFINRGFLIGPYCPIYGVGSVLISLFLTRFEQDPLVVFALGMLLCGTLEYLTSYIMEKLFNARWWDYSERRFNLDGRVCANTLIPFGLLGLALVYWVKPFLFDLFDRLPQTVMLWTCIALAVLLAADIAVSSAVLGKIRKSANRTGADDTEMLTKTVREKLSEQGILFRRTLRAFPYMKIYNNKLLRQMKLRNEAFRKEAAEKARRLREELEGYEEHMRNFRRSRRGKAE